MAAHYVNDVNDVTAPRALKLCALVTEMLYESANCSHGHWCGRRPAVCAIVKGLNGTWCFFVSPDIGWNDDSKMKMTSFGFVLPMLALVAVNLLVIVGNVMVIAAVFTHSKLRSTTTNKFVVSLAVADLMVGLIVLPFSSANQVSKLASTFIS